MRAMVQDWRVSPDMISQAISVIFHTGEKDEIGEVDALFCFVRDAIRYTRDVHQVETLASPVMTLDRRVGDCDDKSTLFATLCEAVGYPTRFVMAGYHGARDFEHVYVQVYTNRGWIDADTTESEPLGFAPANPSAYYVERV